MIDEGVKTMKENIQNIYNTYFNISIHLLFHCLYIVYCGKRYKEKKLVDIFTNQKAELKKKPEFLQSTV